MFHGLFGSDAFLMVISQQLVKEVQSIWCAQVLVLFGDEI